MVISFEQFRRELTSIRWSLVALRWQLSRSEYRKLAAELKELRRQVTVISKAMTLAELRDPQLRPDWNRMLTIAEHTDLSPQTIRKIFHHYHFRRIAELPAEYLPQHRQASTRWPVMLALPLALAAALALLAWGVGQLW